MQSFVNKFNIVLNQNKSEVIINFYQQYPVAQADGEIPSENIEVEVTPVANLIMNGDCAANLCKVLADLLQDE